MGSIMTWAGKLGIKFITRKLNSKRYIEMIDEQINTYATRIAGNNYSSSVVHTAKAK